MSFTYPIYDLTDSTKDTQEFFKTIFIDKIDNIITNLGATVDVKKIKNNQTNAQKKLVISNYIIPLSYLIYSYIYTKFFNFQIKKNIQIENDLNYEMYKFFFDHNNPIIKKINVNLYLYFQKDIIKNLESNIIPFNEIKKEKDIIINFLNYISTRIIEKNDYKNKIIQYEDNLDNFKNIIFQLNKIMILFKKEPPINFDILDATRASLTDLSILIDKSNLKKGITFNTTISNLITINDGSGVLLNIKDITKPFSDYFDIIKDEINKNHDPILISNYEKASKIYLNILDIIKDINVSNLKNDNLLDENSINLYDIFKKYNEISDEKKILDSDKNNQKKILTFISKIKNNISDQNEVYELLFTLNNKKTNKEKNEVKVQSYLKEIKTINTDLLKNIIDAINLLNDINNKVSVPTSKYTNININKNTIITNINAQTDKLHQFNNFLKLFFISLHINEKNEYYYLNKIYNKNIITEPTLKSEYIEDLKFKFDNYFRNYKKLFDNNDEIKNILTKKIKNIDSTIKSTQININTYEKNINNKPNESLTKTTKNETILAEILSTLNTKKNELNVKTESLKNNEKYISDINALNGIINDDITGIIASINNIIDKINRTLVRAPPLTTLANQDINYIINIINNNIIILKNTNSSKMNDFIRNINSVIISYFTSNSSISYDTIENNYKKILNSRKADELKYKFIIEKIKIFESYYNNIKINLENEINKLNNEINNIESKRNILNAKITLKKNEMTILTKKKIILNDIQTKFKDELNKIDNSKKNNENININKEKEEFNNSFNTIYNFSRDYEDKIKKISLDKSTNKINFSYEQNKKFTDIINKIKNINIPDIQNVMIDINNYYNNDDIFMKKINEIIYELSNNETKPFFEQYQKLYQELFKKINNLLDKINNGLLNINDNVNIIIIDIFKNNIIKQKMNKQSNIKNNDMKYSKNLVNKKTIKGKFTEILIYTDNLFYYFIDMLIIIDYLTFFYK